MASEELVGEYVAAARGYLEACGSTYTSVDEQMSRDWARSATADDVRFQVSRVRDLASRTRSKARAT